MTTLCMTALISQFVKIVVSIFQFELYWSCCLLIESKHYFKFSSKLFKSNIRKMESTTSKPSTSNVKTRAADKKKRVISIVGNVSHQISGTKLPSKRQVLQVFFYNMRFVKMTARKSATLAIDAALIFWQQARIPTREAHKYADMLLTLYNDWEKFQKTKVEKMSTTTKSKHDVFVNELDDLFDMASANAIELIQNEEDKQFLEKQRQIGRPGSMVGVDLKLFAKEERSRLRKEMEEARRLNCGKAKIQESEKYFFMYL